LGVLSVIRYALRDGKNFRLVTQYQFLESLRISALCRGYQRALAFFGYIGCPYCFHDLDPPIFADSVAAEEKAIGMPTLVLDENDSEVAGSVADTQILAA
jgi:hypothetical protein